MRRLAVVLFGLILSCTTLQEDPSIPAIIANYPTAEAVVRGERFRGIKIVSIKRGQPLAELDLSVQAVFQGTLKVDSENCMIDETVRYTETGLIPVPIPGVAEKNCVINFTVSPEYPRQRSQTLPVYGFNGKLFVSVIDEEAWFGSTIVLPESGDSEIEIPLGQAETVRVFITGCGIDFNSRTEATDGVLRIPVSEFVPEEKGTCVATGIVISEEYEDLFIDVAVARFSDSFVDLPTPSVTIDGQRVCVDADPSVSFLMSDDRVSNSAKKCFKNPILVRGLTVKGRSFLGEIRDGAVVWK